MLRRLTDASAKLYEPTMDSNVLAKPVVVKGKVVGGGKQPVVCTPVVGQTRAQILAEVDSVVGKKPDLIEWRADYFDGVGNADQVLQIARAIKTRAGAIPILFTKRSSTEGGQPTTLSQDAVVELYSTVCASQCVEMIDFEMDNAIEHVQHVRKIALETDTKLILSYHNFRETPALQALNERFVLGEQLGADVAKVVVMPSTLEDVLTLLAATLQSAHKLKIPLIGISMGQCGSVTRMIGWVFGSAVTYAVGECSSAPGQVSIGDVNTVSEILRKARL